jgi:hypothetical protein
MSMLFLLVFERHKTTPHLISESVRELMLRADLGDRGRGRTRSVPNPQLRGLR